MLGNAGQKISKVVDLAEQLYERVTELREQVRTLQETAADTNDRVAALEDEVAAQRSVLEAIAEAQGVELTDVKAATEGGTRTDGEAATDDRETAPADADERPTADATEER